MTVAGGGLDDVRGDPGQDRAPRWRWTSAASRWPQDLILYLFGAPGQERFWFFWDELSRGAIGAVVLADVRRLDDAFAAIDFFEHRSIPHVVAINQFDGAPMHGHEEIREALSVRESVPLLMCDARRRESSKRVLVTLRGARRDPASDEPGRGLRRAVSRPPNR